MTALGGAFVLSMPGSVTLGDDWRTLTPPVPLPEPEVTGRVDVDCASIQYTEFGSTSSDVVLMLHGGLSASEDLGSRIDALAEKF